MILHWCSADEEVIAAWIVDGQFEMPRPDCNIPTLGMGVNGGL